MRKVLVIDDSGVVRSFHSNILKSSGFDADGAMDGIDGLEKSLSAEYDLILCDINMPNMDGVTFTRRYREEGKETPIVIISTQGDEEQKMKAYEAGVNLYLVKPIKPEDLITHIKMLIGGEANG